MQASIPPSNSITPEAPSSSGGYALFDLDQTLIPWDTQLLFCDFVVKHMPWRRLYLLIFLPFLALHKLLGSEGMKRVFLNYLWGMQPDELDQLAEEFVEQHFPDTFYPEMLELLEQQKNEGRTIILSSASPAIWVKHIAAKLQVDHYFATVVETSPRVRLFPDIIGGNNKGFNKLIQMQAVLPEGFDIHGQEKLPNSHGFSDSHVDLPMLEICEQVSMVNPTSRLLEASQNKNWNHYTPARPSRNKTEFAINCMRQALGIYES